MTNREAPQSSPVEAWDFEYPMEKILEYKNLPAIEKLRWLDAIYQINSAVLTEKQKQFWEKVKNGEI